MSQLCAILLVLMKLVLGYPGETLMVMPPFEVRTLDRYPQTSQFQGRNSQGKPQILHTNVDQNRLTPSMQRGSQNNNFIKTSEVNEAENYYHKEKDSHLKPISFINGRNSNDSAYRSYSGSYARQSSIPYGSTSAYHNPTPPASQPPAQPRLPPLLKPDLSALFNPVTNKVSGKVSGLLGLILSLLSGSSTGLQLTGLKDVFVNGIIQPLLAAKIGIKSLIAKLAIPVVALILINIEVLVTVWWLWDDCPPQNPTPPSNSYTKPTYTNNLNTY